MFELIMLLFLGAAALEMWVAYLVLSGRFFGTAFVALYIFIGLVALVAAFFTTFRYEYFRNSNTRMCGWPVPTIVFQRDDADAPWLDYVGPTIFLAYPMNVVLFLIGPTLIFAAIHLGRQINRWWKHVG